MALESDTASSGLRAKNVGTLLEMSDFHSKLWLGSIKTEKGNSKFPYRP